MGQFLTLDQIADEILFSSFTAMEKKHADLGRYPLDEVKERTGGRRNIDNMFRFREVFGDDLSAILVKKLRESSEERGVIPLSDIEFMVAAKDATWKISVDTEQYRKPSPVARQAIPNHKATTARQIQSGGEWLQHFPYLGEKLYGFFNRHHSATAPAIPKTQVQIRRSEPEPTVEDRNYYRQVLLDTTILLTLVNPEIRKLLKLEENKAAYLNEETYLRETVHQGLQRALEKRILDQNRAERREDHRILGGLLAVNSILNREINFEGKISMINEEINKTLGIILREEEFKLVLELYESRLVNYRSSAVAEPATPPPFRELTNQVPAPSRLISGRTALAYGELRSPRTQIGPYGSVPAPLEPLSADKLIELTHRKLKSAETAPNPRYMEVIRMNYEGNIALEVEKLFQKLAQLGISNGKAVEALELFIAYDQSVVEIVSTNYASQEREILDLTEDAKRQLAPSEKEEYFSRYGPQRGETLFQLAASYVGKPGILGPALHMAEILAGRKK